MNIRSIHVAGLTLIVLLTGVGGGYWLAHRGMQDAAPMSTMAANDGALMDTTGGTDAERKILYWHDPMNPQHKFDKPGKSPFMDMDLVPVYADDEQGSGVKINPALVQSLGVRTAIVEKGSLVQRVDTVGTVQADERRIEVVQSRAAGWVEKLHVRALNDPIKRGQAFADIYAPELLAAQEEFVLVLGLNPPDPQLVTATRQRLSLLGLSDSQIRNLEKNREPQRRVTLHAPVSGILSELMVREGAAVSAGMPLASIVDLSRVWLIGQIPELQLESVATGTPIEVRVRALEDRLFEGHIDYVYPEVDVATRTIRIRASVENPGGMLKPGMVASVTVLGDKKRESLLAPTEAIIRTGRRAVAIVDEGDGRFRAQEVRIGLVSGDRIEILDGLDANTRVVTSGQFLIDSEANLKGAISRLDSTASAEDESAQKPTRHTAKGVVRRIDLESGKVVISHDPVPSLDWPSMTMGFAVKDKELITGLTPEESIEFEFEEGEEDFVISAIHRKGDAK
ncbi:MAG: efflux RND transporter periplasmic adaptor subunit [Burkholderiales bacterium]